MSLGRYAVSYTHLDVYKRQFQESLGVTVLLLVELLDRCEFVELCLDHFVLNLLKEQLGLDVYKRQVRRLRTAP